VTSDPVWIWPIVAHVYIDVRLGGGLGPVWCGFSVRAPWPGAGALWAKPVLAAPPLYAKPVEELL